ncbi:hypothetical protein DZS_19790 [Dickeya ananatis]
MSHPNWQLHKEFAITMKWFTPLALAVGLACSPLWAQTPQQQTTAPQATPAHQQQRDAFVNDLMKKNDAG